MSNLERRTKIGFVAQGDPENPRTFSGVAHRALRALRTSGWDVVPFNSEATTRWELREARLHRLFRGRQANWLTLAKIRVQSRRIQAQLKASPVDLLISTGTTHLAFVNTHVPFVIWNDAVFPSLVNYYESFTYLAFSYRLIGRWADSSVVRKALHSVYSSDWAASEAKRHYRLSPDRVSTIPFGPSLDEVPERESVLTPAFNYQPLQFLFVGMEWERKGGPIAFALLEIFRQRGIAAVLHVVGCSPPSSVSSMSCVKTYGFLARSKPEQAAKLDALFRESHFLLLPSLAECCAQVFLDAATYGLPVIASQTGGTATAVHHLENGYLINLQKRDLVDVADWVIAQISSPYLYRECRRRARDLYESTLNWTRAAEQMSALLEKNQIISSYKQDLEKQAITR